MSAEQEITTSEAAATLDMSRPSLMKLINAGRLEFRKVGKHHRIPASAIQAFLDRQREEANVETCPTAHRQWACDLRLCKGSTGI